MRLLIAMLLVCSLGHADEGDREIARKRYEMGLLLFQRGKYADALKELEAAKAALNRPEFDYNIGLCLAKLDRPADAADALERFVSARPADAEVPSIRLRIAELRGRLQKTPEPPPPPAPQETPPPAAPVEPVPPGVAAEIEEARHPAPPPPPSAFSRFARSPRGIASFTLGGVAVVTLVTAAITGGLALSQNNLYRDSCNLGSCEHGAWETAHSLGIATDVLLSVGVATAVTTIILVLTRPKERPVASAGGVLVRW